MITAGSEYASKNSLEGTHTHTHTLTIHMCYCRCQEALDLNKHLITEEQHEYQHELVRNFRDFQNKLEPMVPTKKKHKRSRYNNYCVYIMSMFFCQMPVCVSLSLCVPHCLCVCTFPCLLAYMCILLPLCVCVCVCP